MARPKKPIDPDQVRKLAAIQCTTAEMASVLNCSSDTLERRFAAIIKEGREHGTMSLKRKQYEIAIGGNVGMLIWLGKQYLGQRDRAAHELSGPDGKPIQTETKTLTDEQRKARIDELIAKRGK